MGSNVPLTIPCDSATTKNISVRKENSVFLPDSPGPCLSSEGVGGYDSVVQYFSNLIFIFFIYIFGYIAMRNKKIQPGRVFSSTFANKKSGSAK